MFEAALGRVRAGFDVSPTAPALLTDDVQAGRDALKPYYALYIGGNLFVTFATDATSTQREVIKLEYQATPRVSLSGVRDQNGGFAFDVRIKKTW